MFGRVISILENNYVRLVVKSDHGELEIDKDVDQIRQVFDVGDAVTIKIGALAGRSGLVEVVDGGHLVIRESKTMNEVCQK